MVTQQTVFQDGETWLKSEVFNESIAFSVKKVPIATGTHLWYSVLGETSNRTSISNNFFPIGRDNVAST